MPKGPTPAENPARRNHKGDRREIAHDARAANVPELPGAEDYCAATCRWYDTWASSPQASTFTATEWMRLHMLAPLVERYFAEPTQQLMAEIRLNEAKLGATLEDRVRLRMKIADPPQAEDLADKPSPSRARRDPRAK